MIRYTFEDIRIVALTIYGEARGEGFNSKKAVAWVIRNRVSDRRWPNSYSKTAKQKKQFSCWNKKDPNNYPMLIVDLNSQSFRECYAAAAQVMCEFIDITYGANHYHTTTMKKYPYWAEKNHKTIVIEHHIFYKL